MADAPIEPQTIEQFQKWSELLGRGQQMMVEFLAKEPTAAPADPMGAMATWQRATAAALADPQRLIDLQTRYLTDAITRWIAGNDPFTARLNLDVPVYNDYDQLMRLDEWLPRLTPEEANEA